MPYSGECHTSDGGGFKFTVFFFWIKGAVGSFTQPSAEILREKQKAERHKVQAEQGDTPSVKTTVSNMEGGLQRGFSS